LISNKKIEKVFAALKKHKDIRVGFSDIDLWADTGVYALNRKLSNTYNKGFLYGRTVGIYGEPGSGKSLLLAQTAANAQKAHNAWIIWIDVEGAVSDLKEGTKWFKQAGLDTDHDFERMHVPTFREALRTVSGFVNLWREDEETKELPPLIIIFDSYSNLQTDSMIEQNKGKKELTQDMGQKARQLGDFLVRVTGMIEGLRVLVAGVMHVYMSQEEYGPRHKISGGIKAAYTASQSFILTKYEMSNEKASPHNRQSNDKDDAKSNIGIRAVAQILKCRYAKPFEKVELEVVYPFGIDPYSGLFDMLVDDKTIVSPSQGWYEFTRPDGTAQKFRRAEFLKYADELMTYPIPERKMNKEDDPVDIFEDDISENPKEIVDE